MFSNIKLFYWFFVLAVSSLVMVHLIVRAPIFPYLPDSANYIEQARSLVEEGAALVNPHDLNDLSKAPSTLFPIGFPLALSLFQLIGIDAREASVGLSWFSSIILPFVLYLSFRGPLGNKFALAVVALSVSAPGFLSHSAMGLADVFSLLLVSISVGLVINSNSRSLIVVAGLLAGIAYSVRNAHAALLISFSIYFLVIWLANKRNRSEVASSVVMFAIGVSAIVAPLFIRNIIVFGSINPYLMEPSTIGVLENIRTYLQEFVYDVTGYRELGRVVAWSLPGLAVFVFLLFLVAWRALPSWGYLNVKQRRTLLLCSIYSFVGACVVIAARSRYQWGEPINIRHTLQYTPFFMVTIVLSISFEAKSVSQSIVKHALALTVAVIAVAHLVYVVVQDSQATIRIERANVAMSAFERGKAQLCDDANGKLLISNFAYVYRINCNSMVRQWAPVAQNASEKLNFSEFMVNYLISLSADHPYSKISVGLYPGRNEINKENFPISVDDSKRLKKDGWSILNNDGTGLLLSR
jgi:hypothetical protein